jgi:hypothetical protein
VYNNYYDGIAKYGIGATYGGSVFVEGNYFRNAQYPMLISMQGSDVAEGKQGTFSSEDGGIIKAYNNYMTGQTRFAAYGDSAYSNSAVEFDAYVVTSRSAAVPGTITTKKGNNTYNNFDTAPGFYSYQADTPEAARDKVILFAGRMSGGDFKWNFNNSVDDTSYAVNTPLQSKLTSYTTTLVSVQGGGSGGNSGGGSGGEDDDGGDDSGGSGDDGGGGITGTVSTSFTTSGPTNPAFTVVGNYSTSKGSATVNGTTYTTCVKMETNTNVSFTITQPMTLTLYFASSESGKKVKVDGTERTTDSNATVEVSLAAGNHDITKKDGINLFYILLSE